MQRTYKTIREYRLKTISINIKFSENVTKRKLIGEVRIKDTLVDKKSSVTDNIQEVNLTDYEDSLSSFGG